MKFVVFLVFYALINAVLANKNVLNGKLSICSMSPLTGFTRTGRCETNANDYGTHLVCAQVTQEFLTYTKGIL